MSEETLEISFDEIEKEREKYLLVDTRDKVTVEYGMIPGAISVPEQELEERLQEFAEHWRKAGTDVTDSYALLPGSDRALWHQYRDDETQYVEDLIYEVQVR